MLLNELTIGKLLGGGSSRRSRGRMGAPRRIGRHPPEQRQAPALRNQSVKFLQYLASAYENERNGHQGHALVEFEALSIVSMLLTLGAHCQTAQALHKQLRKHYMNNCTSTT